MGKPVTYMDFVQKSILNHRGHSSDNGDLRASSDAASDVLLKALNSYSYLADYRTGEYLYFSNTFNDIANYPVHLLKKEGIRHYINLIHKDDWKIINNVIFSSICKFLAETHAQEDKKYRFIFNYRIQKPNGELITIRQINNYLRVDERGTPLLNSGVCTVIPYPVPNNKITYLVQSQNSYQTWENEDVKTFLPEQAQSNKLSPSELNVLHWIKNGYNSERIAEQLNRSLHTIKTHRKNMLEKTQCRNTAELLQYSLSHGLI